MTDGPAAEPLRVLYDESCGLCRRLAEYGKARSGEQLAFVPWQAYAVSEEAGRHFDDTERAGAPSRLRVLAADGAILDDREAWAAILAAYPPFEKFSWIAERLGIMGPVSAATYHGAQWLRQRCRACP